MKRKTLDKSLRDLLDLYIKSGMTRQAAARRIGVSAFPLPRPRIVSGGGCSSR